MSVSPRYRSANHFNVDELHLSGVALLSAEQLDPENIFRRDVERLSAEEQLCQLLRRGTPPLLEVASLPSIFNSVGLSSPPQDV